MKLDPHQEVAKAWLARHARIGLGDEMRVGKTAPTIRAAVEAGAHRVLVLCPPNVRDNWRREIDAWAGDAPSITWDIVSMDTFWRRPYAPVWDTIILDEAHLLRTPTAKRSKAVWGPRTRGDSPLLRHAQRVWLLTGTPMVNNPTDLWAPFRALGWTELSFTQWRERYCVTRETPFGVQIVGTRKEHVPELQALFRRHFLRRRYREVYRGRTEPLLWRATTLTPDALPRELLELERDPELRAVVASLLAKGGESKAEEVALAKLRRLIAVVKAPLTASHVEQYLASDPHAKALVLGWHTEPLRTLVESLSAFGPVLFTGDTSERERLANTARFQQDPRCRVLVGNIIACGTGINLSAATAVVMHETTWVPGDNVQAAMRAVHRDKQAPVPVDLIALAGTTDEAVTRVRARKLQMMSDVYNERGDAQ